MPSRNVSNSFFKFAVDLVTSVQSIQLKINGGFLFLPKAVLVKKVYILKYLANDIAMSYLRNSLK